MVRPRLVEEGAPIYGPGCDAPARRVATDDHGMDGGDHDLGHHSSTELRQISSLQEAAAKTSGLRRPPKRASEVSTAYEVGAAASSTFHSSHQPSAWHAEIRPPSATTTYTHCHHHPHDHQSNMMIGYDNQAKHPTDMEMESEQHTSHSAHLSSHHHHHCQSGPMDHHPSHVQQHSYSTSHLHSPMGANPSNVVQTSYTIGGENEVVTGPVEKMVGVEDHGHKTPMIVLDGANVAHAYGTALAGMYSKVRGSTEPDARGIQVALDYFQLAGLRVLVVLPQYWFRSKPRPGDSQWNEKMDSPQREVLNALQGKGLIVASPPADDDDAYALTIARREESRSLRRNGEGPGFVLSNDMFRDAQARDTTEALKHWLNHGRNEAIGPGRISYSWADMGTMNDHGERILDFVPNPRHPLIIWIEGMSLQGVTLP